MFHAFYSKQKETFPLEINSLVQNLTAIPIAAFL